MLRPSVFNWLERKNVRPIMDRVARSAARGPSANHSASHAAAGAASSSVYHTGDMDDVDGAESLDMMDDIPTDSFGLHASAAPRRHAHPPEPRPRAAGSHSWSSGANFAGAGSGALEHRDRPRREERPANPTRRVITAARRHHSLPTELPSAFRQAHAPAPQTPLSSSPREAQFTDHVTDAPHHEDSRYTAAAVSPPDDSDGATGTDAETAESSGSKTTTAKSSDAYRFLLHHIDAEIAALQRRHASVTTRRQSVQTRQTQRIKELFELMEHPWTLLPTEVQPALPATGVDVYIKEQQIARLQQNPAHPIPEGQDKMYVLALHKNYKSMPAGRKRFYEEAAHHNAAVREELKYMLTRGCSRFEAFLDSIKECTMEMAREGQVPELPTTHAQNRFNAARGSGSNYRHANTLKTLPAGGDASSMRSRKSQQPVHPQQGVSAREASVGDEAEAEEGDTGAEAEKEGEVMQAAKEAGRGTKRVSVGLKRGRKASQRIKAAAKKAHSIASTPAAGGHSSAKVPKGRKGPPPTSAKKQSIAKPAKKGKNSIGARTGANSRGISKGVGRAASSAGVSRSIPLPNLDHLAIKKIKRMVGPSHGSGGAAMKTAKKVSPSLKAAGGGKKKRAK
ncbi:hypothetical protein GH5_01676 [Leishmania sp. Ghana 2012 LV757]|uniref:hypothetical protein n=1 Tax=Leishmania sp. Ghana 2012 LV757 TaxID=2803181 RepID=UPI001B6E8307|nr:hypothetical protein GH5_01676 [Leishmania sp. Ghana 2012 LV757]